MSSPSAPFAQSIDAAVGRFLVSHYSVRPSPAPRLPRLPRTLRREAADLDALAVAIATDHVQTRRGR